MFLKSNIKKYRFISSVLTFLLILQVLPTQLYATKHSQKIKKVRTEVSGKDNDVVEVEIPLIDYNSIKNIKVNGVNGPDDSNYGIVSSSGDKLILKVYGGKPIKEELVKNKHKKEVTKIKESSVNSFPANDTFIHKGEVPGEGTLEFKGSLSKSGDTKKEFEYKYVTGQNSSNYSDSSGYVGTLDRYIYSGSYTPQQTKFVTAQNSSNYNQNGYSGTLTRYLHSGEAGKTSSSSGVRIELENFGRDSPSYVYYNRSGLSTVGEDKDTKEFGVKLNSRSSKTKYTKKYYSRTKVGSGEYRENSKGDIISNDYWKKFYDPLWDDNSSPNEDDKFHSKQSNYYNTDIPRYIELEERGNSNSGRYRTWDLYASGDYYVETTDNVYGGAVTTSTPDTRVYKYQGEVVKPSSDSRTYRYRGSVTKPKYIQSYTGTVFADGKDRYYQYDIEIEYEKSTVAEPIVNYDSVRWHNKNIEVDIVGVDINRAKEIQYRYNGGDWLILPKEGGKITIPDIGVLEVMTISNQNSELNSEIKKVNIENIDKHPPKISIKR